MSNADATAWELWRQDDNGNRFLIAAFDSVRAAEAEQRRFEALGHKQTYWVQPRTGANPDGAGD
ncbi:MAG: hypothetical protein KY467_03210 [Gemmatimonadetes bacterium]|nr:hypothetical protein [Gemmatimonadota bacterium]